MRFGPSHLSRSLLLVSLLLLPDCSYAVEPLQVPVFRSGTDGYHTYRIPSLLATKKGTLLAFCESRKKGAGDSGAIDLLLKRSMDGGKTWQKAQVVWHDGDNTCGNPCAVIDRESGTVWLLMTHNLGCDTQAQIVNGTSTGTRTVWVTKSTDDGLTWSKPVNITKDVKKENWTWYATGPGVGIQMKSGRLVVPCDHQVAGTKVQQSHVIFSDDQGKTWKLGGAVGPQCNECQVVELADGALLLNIRSYRGKNRRVIAFSKDGGETWSDPVEDNALIEPVCQASIVRYPGNKGGLLFCNPASKKREKMSVRFSPDEGKTWPVAKLLHDGPAAYSCLAVLPEGSVGCLYERGDKHPYETITFVRFSLNWLIAQAQHDDKKDLEKFQGNWSLVSAQNDGKAMPKEVAKKFKLSIQANKFVLQKDWVVISEGSFTLDPTKKPKEVDETLTTGPNKAKVFLAIYEIDDSHHRICFAAPGKKRPTAFSSEPGSGQLLRVWKRDKN